jgi:hypothetical protein
MAPFLFSVNRVSLTPPSSDLISKRVSEEPLSIHLPTPPALLVIANSS